MLQATAIPEIHFSSFADIVIYCWEYFVVNKGCVTTLIAILKEMFIYLGLLSSRNMAEPDKPFTWNYRVIVNDTTNPESFGVHSVHYEGNNITNYSAEPVSLSGNSKEDLKGDLELMMQAFDRPVLSLKDLKAKLGE